MTEQQTASAPLQIAVHAQYIRDFSFESPGAPQIFASLQASPQIDMGVNVQARLLSGDDYECLLLLKLEAKVGDKTAFIAELAYGGVFGLPKLPEDQMKFFLFVEAPRLLFPFARSIVATAVRDGGFPPVLISPIDFAALYQQQHARMQEDAKGTA